MEYQSVSARFQFFNGLERYTVHYSYGLAMWYVFKDETYRDALFFKRINPKKSKSPNRESAEEILDEYLELNTPNHS